MFVDELSGCGFESCCSRSNYNNVSLSYYDIYYYEIYIYISNDMIYMIYTMIYMIVIMIYMYIFNLDFFHKHSQFTGQQGKGRQSL